LKADLVAAPDSSQRPQLVGVTDGGSQERRGGRLEDVQGSVHDVAFIGKLLDDLGTVVKVDERRVDACGMSNGGMMRQPEFLSPPHLLRRTSAPNRKATCPPLQPQRRRGAERFGLAAQCGPD
jgi:poly(3-hydroxybutyrate) depolymerase